MKLASLRVVPALEQWPRLVAFARTSPGRLCLVAIFACGLWLHGSAWWAEGALVLATASLLPGQRRTVLFLATLWWLGRYVRFPWPTVRAVADSEGVGAAVDWGTLQAAAVVCGLGFAILYHALARARPRLGPLRRPIVTWFALLLSVLALASYAPLGGHARVGLWAFAVVVLRYAWFVPLSLLDRHTREPHALLTHVGLWQPFWMAASQSSLPIPKGAAYARRIEAKDDLELAVCQLKAVKLLWWAGVLVAVQHLFEWFVNGNPHALARVLGLEAHLGIPGYGVVFDAFLAGTPHPAYIAWAALLARFVSTLLSLATFGHVIVATCRMMGFRALRNTYRPLEATTIAEFWNRYFYYFKELLVDVFFYPTFLRYLKGRPGPRLFVATLAAAGAGNVLFHFLLETDSIAQHGLFGALWEFRVYGIYGLVLAVAIGLSQARARRRRDAPGPFARRVVAPASVLAFYCVLSVFDSPLRSASIGDHVGFLLSLVGLS